MDWKVNILIAVLTILISVGGSWILAWVTSSLKTKELKQQYELEQNNFYKRVAYETEFEAYKQISEKLFELIPKVVALPVQKPFTPYIYNDTRKSFSTAVDTIYRNAPFINSVVFDEIEISLKSCTKVLEVCEHYHLDNSITKEEYEEIISWHLVDELKWRDIVRLIQKNLPSR